VKVLKSVKYALIQPYPIICRTKRDCKHFASWWVSYPDIKF